MIYLIGALTFLAILFFIFSRYNHYRDVSAFLKGVDLKDRFFVKKVLNKVTPKPSDPKYKAQTNQCFILNTRFDIRDFYLLKLFVVLSGVVLSICIVATNVANRYSDSYDVSSYIACEMNSTEFKALSRDLKFPDEEDAKAVSSDLSTLQANVTTLNEAKFKSCNREDLYDALKSVRKSQSHMVRFVDFLIITTVLLACWALPDYFLKKICLFLGSNSLREYDSLLSVLLISRYYDTEKIIRNLTDSARYYTNFFREFEVMYESAPTKAFNYVMTKSEFPTKFKDIVRYLSVLDSEGPEALEVLVSARKDQIQDDIIYHQDRIQNKRKKLVNRICVIAFLASMIRVLVVMLYAI